MTAPDVGPEGPVAKADSSAGGSTGGDRTLVPPLVRAAVAVGVDALFLEVHPDPDRAPSDGPNSLDYAGLVKVLREVQALSAALASTTA